MEQMERDRMSDPRRARASHAPGAAVRKFHALMHPLVARLKRRKRQVAERVLHVGPRPRAAPDCVRWRENGDLSHLRTSFRVVSYYFAPKGPQTFPAVLRRYPNNFTKTIYPYEVIHTRPYSRTTSDRKNPGRTGATSEPTTTKDWALITPGATHIRKRGCLLRVDISTVSRSRRARGGSHPCRSRCVWRLWCGWRRRCPRRRPRRRSSPPRHGHPRPHPVLPPRALPLIPRRSHPRPPRRGSPPRFAYWATPPATRLR